jgi:putative pre-16S rRNA nuclease
MTFLALDVGARRIGVAVGGVQVRLATPLGVIQRGKLENDAASINRFTEEYSASRIVIGLPLELDGSIGLQAKQVLDYASRLAPLLQQPYEFFDERYSTAEALSRRRAAGLTDKRGRATIDAAAAAVILQDYLDGLK